MYVGVRTLLHGAFELPQRKSTMPCLVLSCLLTLYTAVMSFEILFPFDGSATAEERDNYHRDAYENARNHASGPPAARG